MLRILRLTAGAALVLVGVTTFAALVLPRLLGWHPYVVTSGSMVPTFDPGAVVVSAPVDAADIEAGDIITFRDPQGLVTHRVVNRMSASQDGGPVSYAFRTKGDANEDADASEVDPRNVVGVARFAVPKLGYLVFFVKTPLGAAVLVGLFLLVLLSGGDRGRKRDTGEPTPEAARPAPVEAAALS